jgi:antitoxin component YwqK of YwqJK toxin-antitoxin module
MRRNATQSSLTTATVSNQTLGMGQFRPYSSQFNRMPIIGHCRKRSLIFLSTWRDDKQDGLFQIFTEDGKTLVETNYKNGVEID